jgi:hypothetical protein
MWITFGENSLKMAISSFTTPHNNSFGENSGENLGKTFIFWG